MLPSRLTKALAVLFFGFTLWSCQPENPVDLILLNGKIWTGEDDNSFAEAVAIKDNKIQAVGTSEEIAKLKGKNTKEINLEGKLVIPGFNDAHIHFLSGSLGLNQVDLTGTGSASDITERVNQFIKENPTRSWITGRGWQYASFESGLPDHNSLAGITNDVPVFIRAYDGHSAWANKKALQLAGIDRHTKFEGFGEIVKDKHGEPTGALRESSMGLVGKFVPEPTREEKLNALRLGIKLASSLGITSMQNASGSEEELKLYLELLKNNELNIRFASAFSAGNETSEGEIIRFTALKDSIGKTNAMLRADAIKFMIDGVIESHTAYMLEPYVDLSKNDPLAYGQIAVPVEKYQELVTAFDRNGFRIYTHAIGDKGVRESLNAYEAAAKKNGKRDSRHRVEHIETISPQDIDRFKQLDVMPSMEPIHADPETVEVWAKAIGETRLPWSFPWASMLKSEAHLVFSSDWPACIDLNPIRGIHVAVNRRTPKGFPENGWIPEQKIPITDALKAYTAAGAYSSFEENIKGKIKAGQLADVIVLSQDLFTIEPMKTYQTNVLMTVFDGKIIYEASN
jgi:predicted amidohydrolase YtcJ